MKIITSSIVFSFLKVNVWCVYCAESMRCRTSLGIFRPIHKTASPCYRSFEARYIKMFFATTTHKCLFKTLKTNRKRSACLFLREAVYSHTPQKNNASQLQAQVFSSQQSTLCSALTGCPRPKRYLGSRRALCLGKQLFSQPIHSHLQRARPRRKKITWLHS